MIGVDTTVLVHLQISESPEHQRAHNWLRNMLDSGETIALAPQVLPEFVHVVTDSKRFQKPLRIEEAIQIARDWWMAEEVRHVFPTSASTGLLLDWLSKHGLGRKRLLDTYLAATLRVAGVERIVTGNARDFSVFGGFELLTY